MVFRGADSGSVEGRPGAIRFERSLEVDQLRDTGALMAFATNGESLPVQHGYPLRLVVPPWNAQGYGNNAVQEALINVGSG